MKQGSKVLGTRLSIKEFTAQKMKWYEQQLASKLNIELDFREDKAKLSASENIAQNVDKSEFRNFDSVPDAKRSMFGKYIFDREGKRT